MSRWLAGFSLEGVIDPELTITTDDHAEAIEHLANIAMTRSDSAMMAFEADEEQMWDNISDALLSLEDGDQVAMTCPDETTMLLTRDNQPATKEREPGP